MSRPRTRAECADVPRPCPYVGCRHHLYLDVHPGSGRILFRFPSGVMPWDLDPASSCALDVADRGPHTDDALGAIYGITRQRIYQIRVHAMARLPAGSLARARETLAEFSDGEPDVIYRAFDATQPGL